MKSYMARFFDRPLDSQPSRLQEGVQFPFPVSKRGNIHDRTIGNFDQTAGINVRLARLVRANDVRVFDRRKIRAVPLAQGMAGILRADPRKSQVQQQLL